MVHDGHVHSMPGRVLVRQLVREVCAVRAPRAHCEPCRLEVAASGHRTLTVTVRRNWTGFRHNGAIDVAMYCTRQAWALVLSVPCQVPSQCTITQARRRAYLTVEAVHRAP